MARQKLSSNFPFSAVIQKGNKTTLTILAPCFSPVHDVILETIRYEIASLISQIGDENPYQNVLILGANFCNSNHSPAQICTHLGRVNTRGVILLIRLSSWFAMCRQIDMTLGRLWTTTTKAPNIPLCVFVCGDRQTREYYRGFKDSHSKKNLLHRALSRYLTDHTSIPAILFPAELVQIRQCYTDCLLKDKIRETLSWIGGEMNRGKAHPRKSQWSCQVEAATEPQNCSPRSGCTTTNLNQRSLSEPRKTPYAPNANVTVRHARETINTSLLNTTLRSNLRKKFVAADLTRMESSTHRRNSSPSPEVAEGNSIDNVAYLFSIFQQLKAYHEYVRHDVRVCNENLKAIGCEPASSSSSDFFRSSITWLTQQSSQKVTHFAVNFQIGSVYRHQLMRLPKPLTKDELRELRALYLDHYVTYTNDTSGSRKHRSHSVHVTACGSDWLECSRKGHKKQDWSSKAKCPRMDKALSEAAVPHLLSQGRRVPWTMGDGRTISVPKDCLHRRNIGT